MELIAGFLPHILLYGFLAVIGIVAFLLLGGLVIVPFYWITSKINDSRCPQCRGFFKRKLVDWEITDEREVLKTVNRVDQGMVHSNNLFEPSQALSINRQEQVTFVEQTILNHWACKDSLCGHRWTTEEYCDHEGSLST